MKVFFHVGIPFFFMLGVLLLLGTIICSGLYYQYDNDELAHVQSAYLIRHGAVPYKDFFFRYPPFFSWVIMPQLAISGESFDAFWYLRVWMVVLFFLRVVSFFWLSSRLLPLKVSCVSVLLFIIDPFHVFSGMQIRPDNLMMLFLLYGLVFLTYAYQYGRKYMMVATGMFLSFSTIALLKIIPIVCIVISMFLMYLYAKRRLGDMLIVLLAFVVPWGIFVVSMMGVSLFHDMVQQMIFDTSLMNRYMLNPTSATFFYRMYNIYILGSFPYPLLWIFCVLLLLCSIVGSLIAISPIQHFRNMAGDWKEWCVGSLAIGWILQMMSIFLFPGAFIQYFLSVGWGMAFFCSFALNYWMTSNTSQGVRMWSMRFIWVFLIISAGASMLANMFRYQVRSDGLISSYHAIWEEIPDTVASFPNMLFRPLAYPIPYGTFFGDLPSSIISRYGSPADAIQKKQVKYVFYDSYAMQYYDAKTREYLSTEYIPTHVQSLYVKK